MSRARRRSVKGLIIAGSVLAFLSVFAIWIERQALNTSDWVDTSDQLIQNQKIRTAVANYLIDQIYENVDVKKELEDVLPGESKQFAGPISGGLRQFAGTGAEKLLETSTAQGLWENANQTAHEQLLDVLEDRKESVSTEEGDVKLELRPLAINLAGQFGIGDLAENLPEDVGEITILRSDDLKTAQNVAVAVKGLALVLSLLTLLAFGLAIYLSRDERWVTVLFCGIGLIAAGFAVIVAREILGGIVVGQLVSDASVKPAGEETWSIATSLMTSIATTVIVVGVFFGIAGWLASPTGSAKATRRVMAPPLREFPAYVYAGLAIVVGLYFLEAPTQNLRSFLTTLAIAGFAAFGIHELRGQTEDEFPGATFDDVFGGTRDRVVGAVKSANLGEKASNLGERASKLRLPEVRGPQEEGSPARGSPGAARRRRRPPREAGATRGPAREGRAQRRGARHREGPRPRGLTQETIRWSVPLGNAEKRWQDSPMNPGAILALTHFSLSSQATHALIAVGVVLLAIIYWILKS